MGSYRLAPLRSLARQLSFTPAAKRLGQLCAAEELLHEIEPGRAYPPAFVVFRVTGFRGKDGEAADRLAGEALRHDLGLLVEEVSETLDLQADEAGEPVLDIAAAAERFGVSTKSIQRWRRRGLCARRFVFPDGKRRVGFLLSAVERFVGGQSPTATKSDALDDATLRRVGRHAGWIAAGCDEAELCRRVARKLNRSPAAVLHHLRRHDQLWPDAAALPRVRPAVTLAQRKAVRTAAAEGLPLRRIAEAAGLGVRLAARVLVQQEADRLAERPVRFIDDPLFERDDAAAMIDELCGGGDLSGTAEAVRVPKGLPPYLADLYRTPLLTPARERALFLKLNFHRRRYALLRADLDPALATRRELSRLRREADAATAVKNDIVRANLRLVVSVAKQHVGGGRGSVDLMELVSDGNLVLMRAVDGFNVGRGNKFSTYATLALMKGFARSVPQLQSRIAATLAGDVAEKRAEVGQHLADAEAAAMLLARLDEDERAVLLGHRGLRYDGDRLTETDPLTLAELTDRLGVSRHRVRQLEADALDKLRA